MFNSIPVTVPCFPSPQLLYRPRPLPDCLETGTRIPQSGTTQARKARTARGRALIFHRHFAHPLAVLIKAWSPDTAWFIGLLLCRDLFLLCTDTVLLPGLHRGFFCCSLVWRLASSYIRLHSCYDKLEHPCFPARFVYSIGLSYISGRQPCFTILRPPR